MGCHAGKQCPAGSSSCLQHMGVTEAEHSCVCVSVCTALPSRSTSEAMQRCGDVCWAGTGCVSTVLGAGGHVWRPAVTVNALQSSPAASQASSREFRHFPSSSRGHCLAVINITAFPTGYSWGKEKRYDKTPWAVLLRKCPQSISPFCVLPRFPLWNPQQLKLLVVVNLLKSYILLAWCKFFSYAWFCWKSSASLTRAFSTVTVQFL